MKYLFNLLMVVSLSGSLTAQNLNKTIDVGSATMINISSDYPSIEIHTGEGTDLIVEGYILANGLPLDDVVDIKWNKATSSLSFVTDIDLAKKKTKNRKSSNLDHLSKEELKSLIKSSRNGNNHKGHSYFDGQNNWNLETHIIIYLPKGMTKIDVDMVYGGFEMDHIARDVNVYNKYGKIEIESDANMDDCVLESTYASVTLRAPSNVATDYRLQSNYGEIFTDVDINVNRGASTHQAYKTIIVGSIKNGGNQSIKMRSDYSNIYLHKL